MARCPAHDDERPSLSIKQGANDRVFVKCFAGCERNSIRIALGLEAQDLFEAASSSLAPTHSLTRPSTVRKYPAQGDLPPTRKSLTVGALAAHKGLSDSYLRKVGLHDLPGGRGVGIPYRDATGQVV